MIELVSFERGTLEDLQKNFESFIGQMTAMARKGTDKRLGQWLDNSDVCRLLSISPRTLQTLRDNGTLAYSQIERKIYYRPEDVNSIMHLVEDRKKDAYWRVNGGQDKQGKQ